MRAIRRWAAVGSDTRLSAGPCTVMFERMHTLNHQRSRRPARAARRIAVQPHVPSCAHAALFVGFLALASSVSIPEGNFLVATEATSSQPPQYSGTQLMQQAQQVGDRQRTLEYLRETRQYLERTEKDLQTYEQRTERPHPQPQQTRSFSMLDDMASLARERTRKTAATVPPASPLLPPDVEVRSYCTSHAVYLRVLNGAISRRGVPPHARSSVADSAAPSDYSHATSDRESQLVILVLICVFSLIILAFGNRFMNISLALILFIGCFLLIFGAVDAIAFRERSPFTYVPCALPLVLGVFFGVVLAMLALCILQKFVWLAFFLLGASLGTTVMFILRLGILNFHEGTRRSHDPPGTPAPSWLRHALHRPSHPPHSLSSLSLTTVLNSR